MLTVYGGATVQPSSSIRSFTGPALAQIAVPLGGIGTGAVSLGGRGNLQDWEIFNRPGKGDQLFKTICTLRLQPQGGMPVSRLLEREYLPPFSVLRREEPHPRRPCLRWMFSQRPTASRKAAPQPPTR